MVLDESEGLLSRAVSVIDLRIADRITIQTAPQVDSGDDGRKAAPLPQARLGAPT